MKDTFLKFSKVDTVVFLEIKGTSPGQKPSCEIIEDLQLGVSTAKVFFPSQLHQFWCKADD
jgi:hypothetical protein